MGARDNMIQGTVDPNFWYVARALQRQVHAGGGAAVCVYHRGRKVVDIWAGDRDQSGNPWKRDTMAMSFSTSKGVMSTIAHIMADRGELDYDARVADYWPEFARAGKARITVRDVMTHRAGLARLRPLIDSGRRMLDWEHMVDALERARPCARTKGRPAYHGLTYGWLIGEILQRVSGRSVPELVATELVEPLGLDGMYIGAHDLAKKRAARLQQPEERQLGIRTLFDASEYLEMLPSIAGLAETPVDLFLIRDALMPEQDADVFWHDDVLDAPIPAANGLFTARSLAKMYAAVAEGGSLDGTQLLSERKVHEMGEVQTVERDRVLVFPLHWRLGYHSAFTTRGRVSSGFGHFGYGGSGAWADPDRRLSVAMVNNQSGGGPFGDYRIAELGNAAMRGARMAEGKGETLVTRAIETALASNPLLKLATSTFQR